jgi:hypothetical protein
MARHIEPTRDHQRVPFLHACVTAGQSQEILAARMGIPHIKFRKVVNGHERATPYFIARFVMAVGESDAFSDPDAQLRLLFDLVGASAMFEYGSGMEHEARVWRKRPVPWAPPCEVSDDG